MPGFKDAGQFIPTSLAISEQEALYGGVNLPEMVAIKHPNFRLRAPGQKGTRFQISSHDISPIKTTPQGMSAVKLPDSEQISMGIEAEFHTINPNGELVSLYGRDTTEEVPNGKTPSIVLHHNEASWPIDQIPGLTPEGLKFQGEIATQPSTSSEELHKSVLATLKPIAQAFQNKGWLILPTGLSGKPLKPVVENISPHPYIVDIMYHGLQGSALNFDANTVQGHVDHSLFGSSLEFMIHQGNCYNAVLATMLNALGLSGPFWKGNPNGYISHREFARNHIATLGGVQDNIPVNGWDFLARGHAHVTSGTKPVPERAGGGQSNGSHNDFRPKLSTGTGEHGSMDSNPNVDLWVAQTVMLREFTRKVAESVTLGTGHLPSFLEMDSFPTRKSNRITVAKHGVDATISTKAGKLTVRQAWENFFAWAQPSPKFDDWDRAVDTIRRGLAQNAKDVHDYFNPNSPNYSHGSIGIAMIRTFESLPGTNADKIDLVNVAVAQGFMGYISRGY